MREAPDGMERKSLFLARKTQIYKDVQQAIRDVQKLHGSNFAKYLCEVAEEILLENSALLFPDGNIPKVTLHNDEYSEGPKIFVDGQSFYSYIEGKFTELQERDDPNV